LTNQNETAPKLSPAGEGALLVTLGNSISPLTNRRVRALAAALESAPLNGSLEMVPGYASLLVYYDCLKLDYAQVENWVRQHLAGLETSSVLPARRVEIPVYYGGEHGPDLDDVAKLHQLSPAEVIRIHTGRDYPVYMLGFTPGFPYLGEMDAAIATPRLGTPRSRVPAGSVGIAGEQTGIYPLDSPGGWRIIGWTPLRLFDPQRHPPFLLAHGDLVRFVALNET
jgi:inhibitor of KinA